MTYRSTMTQLTDCALGEGHQRILETRKVRGM
jgi:hypothetical protein